MEVALAILIQTRQEWYTDRRDGDGSTRINPWKSVSIRSIRVPFLIYPDILSRRAMFLVQTHRLSFSFRVERVKISCRRVLSSHYVSPIYRLPDGAHLCAAEEKMVTNTGIVQPLAREA